MIIFIENPANRRGFPFDVPDVAVGSSGEQELRGSRAVVATGEVQGSRLLVAAFLLDGCNEDVITRSALRSEVRVHLRLR